MPRADTKRVHLQRLRSFFHRRLSYSVLQLPAGSHRVAVLRSHVCEWHQNNSVSQQKLTVQQVIPALMSLYMDHGSYMADWKTKGRTVLNIATLCVGSFITVAGTYTTVQSIIDAYRLGTVGSAFSC